MANDSWTEVERTFDVDAATVLPTMVDVDGVARVGQAVELELEAVYFDTVDLDLTRRGVTVRRRTGGADAGWHLKLPRVGDTRIEVRRPLGRATRTVPPPLLEPVRAMVRDRRLVPVARIATRRRERALLDADGAVLAHVCDDHVRTEQLHLGDRVDEWREWEVELVAGDHTLLDRVEELFRDAGAEPAQATSKLARTLADHLPPAPSRTRKKELRRSTAGAAVTHRLDRQVDRLLAQDRRVRSGEEGSVHKMRIAARRLRSALKTYGPLFDDATATDSLGQELRWLGQALAPARDAQVLRERLIELVAAEPDHLVLGPVAAVIDDDLRAAERDAREATLVALEGQRYFRLLDALDELVQAPSFTAEAEKAARKVFPRLLHRDAKRLRRSVKEVRRAESGEKHDVALHDARKKAKRLRYAAESMTPVLGKRADELAASVKVIQRVLGQFQDTVMSRRVLRDYGARAHVEGHNGFTYGRLHMLEEARAEAAVREFDDAWTRLSLKGLRRR
ncbi:CYTH and CHAD domain-containing protein [Nocardioides eburneiflavus]|uniref:CYTH and CHAD domain-containing protein n=1 Tax=Nocardioides eburneiflavus TaxID=2518372 RepID=A0A4Z1CJB3_9ACTN|nr:CYTH and CHAD domain-containing protein [Nocardioides eburneiflavus]TGN63250.1 CYTH and CHAD domain-containing protein [Nocardioides eburneiflavus]